MSTLLIIALAAIVAFIVLLALALCRIAAIADERAAEQHEREQEH